MKVIYDQEVDILRIILNDADIEESDEDKPGIVIDYDGNDNIAGPEILDASTRMDNPRRMNSNTQSRRLITKQGHGDERNKRLNTRTLRFNSC